jgi:quercetin dioxygenase-like cupin family protein
MKLNVILLCIAFLSLFACSQNEATKVEAITLIETNKSWNGTDLPEYPEGKPKITVLKITIPPYSKLNIHKHLVINAGVLIKGELTVVDEQNNTLNLKAGDALVELVNTYHYGENKGSVPAEIIVFYAGTEDLPITVTKNNEFSDH